MADDNSLLIRIKGDASGGKAAIAETRAAMATLRTSVGTEMSALRVSTTNAAQGTRQLVNGFQALSAGVTVIDGPLGGIASRIRAMGTVASEATQILSSTGTAAAGTGAQIAAIAGPIGLAIAAAAAMVGVAALLTKGLFDLAVSAADFRGKLFDLSQQTGVAVETLSTLEIVAKTTGGSIESIAQSLVIFQGHLDDAQDATSKMGIKFKELGISTNDTETAFREALTQIAKMSEGFEQTNTAAELFGRRGGKQILAILKELDGDLDGATEKFRELGIVISTEDARAADEFNDQLAILQFQFRALLGQDVMPAALSALKDLSKTLKDNQEAVKALGTALGLLSSVVGLFVKGNLVTLQALWEAHAPVVDRIVEAYERIAKAIEAVQRFRLGLSGLEGGAAVGGLNATAGVGLPEVGGAAAVNLPGQKGVFAASLMASDDQAKKELELERSLRAQLNLDFEKRNSDLNEHYDRQKQLVDLHLATLNEQIARERLANRRGFEQGAIDAEEFANRQRDLDLRAAQAKSQQIEETIRLTLELRKNLDQQEIQLRERSFALSEARRKGELDRIKVALDRQGTTESEALTRQLEFLKQTHTERIGIINFELKALSTSTERKKELDAEKALVEQEYTDTFKRLTQERIDAANAESVARHAPTGVSFSPDQIAVAAGAAANAVAGVPPILRDTRDAFGELGKEISNVFGLGREGAEIFGGVMTTAFGMLAQAVGEAVHAFVLFGGAGTGVKKFTAIMIAEIAKMAAVQAVWELAQGLAMLALNFFWPDPKLALAAAGHFHAAAVYGGLAAVAAGVGRAVAGGSFAAQGAGGGGGGTGAGNPGRNPSDRPSAIEVDRGRQGLQATSQQPTIVIHLSGEAAAAFDYKVVKAVVGNHRLNGEIRSLTERGES